MIPARLAITLLGEFSLTLSGGQTVSFSGDRPISLLAYLLLHRHTPVSRQQLAFTLWPDSNDSQARANLRNLYFTLRQTLPDADSYLAADAMTLQWRPEASFTLDVAEYEAALAAAGEARSPADRIAHLESALALYKGDLLPSNYDDWIIPLREALRQNHLEALHQLVLLHEQQQDYRAAARYGQRLLQQDPLDETTYVTLMRLHAQSGDRAGVRRVYDLCVTTLRRELDVEPSTGTQAAFEQLLHLDAPAREVETVVTLPPPAAFRPRPLPTPATPFVGREAELAHVAELLSNPDCRLLTIIGPGGVGKTRLALETAAGHQRIYANGVIYVPLVALQDEQMLANNLADTLGLSLERQQTDTLLAHLQDKECLLVFDNFEHLLPAAGLLSLILNAAPRVKCLTTSRQRLNLQEEWLFELEGLSVPDSGYSPMPEANSAVALFYQSARRADARFTLSEDKYPAIAAICGLVNGMPLGIELAASWVRLLTCDEIAQEIERSLDFLQSSHQNVPSRHSSLRAVFDHSWNLLSAAEQRLLRQLSLFRGGFRREAAEAVVGATLQNLTRLADNSLLRRIKTERYSLHELVRQYAYEKLVEAGELDELQVRLLQYWQQFVTRAEQAISDASHTEWPQRVNEERDNFWASMNWAASASGEALEEGIRLAILLIRYWVTQGQNQRAYDWLIARLPQRETLSPEILARMLNILGLLAFYRNEFTQAAQWLQESRQLAQEIADVGTALQAQMRLGSVYQGQQDFEKAEAAFGGALAGYRDLNDLQGVTRCLNNLGSLAFDTGQPDQAKRYYEEALALSRQRNDADATANALVNLAWYAILSGEPEGAADLCRECISLCIHTQNTFGITYGLEGLGGALAGEAPRQSVVFFAAAAHLRRQYNMPLSELNTAYIERMMQPARDQLEDAAFAAAWEQGESLPFEEIVRLAQANSG